VGKATNLRARVRQYFYGDQRRTIANLMRELASIEHIVCETPLEAEVTELRLIHTHRPRYNRRSKPPKTSHWVKVTREPFPRLSVVRTLKDDALAHLGPFRSKRAADMVVAALWDATLIRRCRTPPSTRTAQCAAAQLGVALCPCDGSLSPAEYRPIIERLIEGLDHEPDILLAPLVDRMALMASQQRFEEAGWLRDRHGALARAIDRRRIWGSLTNLGLCEVESQDGCRALIDHGRLVATWRLDRTPPLRPAPPLGDQEHHEVPASVEMAEEADLVWRWLDTTEIRLVEATGFLALPCRPVRRLEIR
jgi:DNA polymerase-3 subunit epsilon